MANAFPECASDDPVKTLPEKLTEIVSRLQYLAPALRAWFGGVVGRLTAVVDLGHEGDDGYAGDGPEQDAPSVANPLNHNRSSCK
jgi:hypothetical protein